MAEPWRTLRWSSWLGWQIESNWANWKLFLLYMVVKPVTGSMMLVCMYYAVKYAAEAGGSVRRVPPEFLPYVYVSSACYAVVTAVMFGMSQVVISDRESYRMLKYIFISPGRFQAYFVGRGLAKMLEGVAGAVITLSFGLLLPPVREALHPTAASLAWLAVYLSLGAVLLWSAGMVLASAMLNMSRSASFLSEGIAGVVYFLSGVVFPLSILPQWLQTIGMALPTTYWLEGMRRAISGPPGEGASLPASPLAGWSDADLTLALAASSAGLLVFSQWLYRRCLDIAWRAGRIDEVTGL